MKRFICAMLVLCLLYAILGCSQTPDPTESDPIATPAATEATPVPSETASQQIGASAVYEAPMASAALPLIVEAQNDDANTPIAYYTHQDVSITLPDADVAQAVTLDLLNRIDKTRIAANAVLEAAKEDYSGQAGWYPYSYAITYQPMRLDENVLSLFGTETSFDGSPMSIHNAISVSYDLTTGEALNLRTILHEENYADALCDMILEGLKPSAESLFADYESIVRGKFSTNVTVSSWYFSSTGLCFYFAPYEIAPYSAGTIISEVPYDRLSGLLNDIYFPSEQLIYSGAVLAEKLNGTIPEIYTQFAEVKLDAGGDKLLITTDGSVSNVQLKLNTNTPETGAADVAVLTLAGLGPTDAILLDADIASLTDLLSITFDSYGERQTLYLKENANGSLIFTK